MRTVKLSVHWFSIHNYKKESLLAQAWANRSNFIDFIIFFQVVYSSRYDSHCKIDALDFYSINIIWKKKIIQRRFLVCQTWTGKDDLQEERCVKGGTSISRRTQVRSLSSMLHQRGETCVTYTLSSIQSVSCRCLSIASWKRRKCII